MHCIFGGKQSSALLELLMHEMTLVIMQCLYFVVTGGATWCA